MSLILSGIVNICQLVGSIPILLYMDQMGRRRIAIFGALAMAIPHFIMAGIVGKFSSNWEAHKGVGWFGVALICELLPLLIHSVSNHSKTSMSLATPCHMAPSAGSFLLKYSQAQSERRGWVSRLQPTGSPISLLGSLCHRCLCPLAGGHFCSLVFFARLPLSFRFCLCRKPPTSRWNKLPRSLGIIFRWMKKSCGCVLSERFGLRHKVRQHKSCLEQG